MLKALITKEIQESILNLRFYFILVICLTLIPLSFYLGADEYVNRKDHIDHLERLYLQQNEGNVRYDIHAEGYRRPSPFSIFSFGLENFLPDKVVTDRDKNMQFERQWGLNNPLSLLTGKLDFLYVTGFIMSLLVLTLTFNSVSGEKENGTLRLVLSNQVPRWKIIVAKIVGPYSLFAICFVAGILLGIILLQLTKSGIEMNADFYKVLSLVTLLSLLFLFALFNLGTFLSIVSKSTYISMVIGLLVYVFLALLVPKLSPMLAQVIYPIKSIQVHNAEKNILVEQKNKEREDKKKELMNNLKNSYGIPLSLGELDKTPEKRAFYDEKIEPLYDEQTGLLDEKYNKELEVDLTRIDNEFLQKTNTQKAIALNISRLSPVSSFYNLITDLSSTGFMEIENYNAQAQKFQFNVKADIYDKVRIMKYYDQYGYLKKVDDKGFDSQTAEVPIISDYTYLKPSFVVDKNRADFMLICAFTIIFFMACVVAFLRFDVR